MIPGQEIEATARRIWELTLDPNIGKETHIVLIMLELTTLLIKADTEYINQKGALLDL